MAATLAKQTAGVAPIPAHANLAYVDSGHVNLT